MNLTQLNKFQSIRLEQDGHDYTYKHIIEFACTDIESIEPFITSMCTQYFINKCEIEENNICSFSDECKYCTQPNTYKWEQFFIDGFEIYKDDYVATLKRGIKVPVPKFIYDAFIIGFSEELKRSIIFTDGHTRGYNRLQTEVYIGDEEDK